MFYSKYNPHQCLLQLIVAKTFLTIQNIAYIGNFNFTNNWAYMGNPLYIEVD